MLNLKDLDFSLCFVELIIEEGGRIANLTPRFGGQFTESNEELTDSDKQGKLRT